MAYSLITTYHTYINHTLFLKFEGRFVLTLFSPRTEKEKIMKMKRIAAGISAIVLAASTTIAVSAASDVFDYDMATANEAPELLTSYAVSDDETMDIVAFEEVTEAEVTEAIVTEEVVEETTTEAVSEEIAEAEVTTAVTEETTDVTDITEKKGPKGHKDVTVSITDDEVSKDILDAIEEALENSPKANEESWTNPLSDIDDEQMTFDFIIKHADVRPDGTIHVDGVVYNEDLSKLISYSPEKKDKEFKVPPTVKEIEESAFEGNEHLEKVHIGEGTKKIGPKAFKDCPKLHEVEMNKDVKVIGPKAFEGTEDLTVIEIPDNVKAFIEDAFDNSESIEDLVMYALDKYASVKFGDLNGDDVTDLTDLSILAVKLMDKDNFSKIETIVADVMEDSKVDIADLARLKQYVMGEKIVLGPQV